MSMSQAKFEGAFRGLSSIARHVYEAVPAMDVWSANQVHAEIRRAGRSVDARVVLGCLMSLVESGLVREPKSGMFIRQHVKEERELTVVSSPVVKKVAPAAVESLEDVGVSEASITKFGSISAGLREQAKKLIAIADEIDAAALSLAERVAKDDQETAKLRQLQRLLKELQ